MPGDVIAISACIDDVTIEVCQGFNLTRHDLPEGTLNQLALIGGQGSLEPVASHKLVLRTAQQGTAPGVDALDASLAVELDDDDLGDAQVFLGPLPFCDGPPLGRLSNRCLFHELARPLLHAQLQLFLVRHIGRALAALFKHHRHHETEIADVVLVGCEESRIGQGDDEGAETLTAHLHGEHELACGWGDRHRAGLVPNPFHAREILEALANKATDLALVRQLPHHALQKHDPGQSLGRELWPIAGHQLKYSSGDT